MQVHQFEYEVKSYKVTDVMKPPTTKPYSTMSSAPGAQAEVATGAPATHDVRRDTEWFSKEDAEKEQAIMVRCCLGAAVRCTPLQGFPQQTVQSHHVAPSRLLYILIKRMVCTSRANGWVHGPGVSSLDRWRGARGCSELAQSAVKRNAGELAV